MSGVLCNNPRFVAARLLQKIDFGSTSALPGLAQAPGGPRESVPRRCGIAALCQEMTAPDDVCVAAHDGGSVEPKCHAGPQEQEASLATLAAVTSDSKAPTRANPQAPSTCDAPGALLCFQPRSRSEARNGGGACRLDGKRRGYGLAPPVPPTREPTNSQTGKCCLIGGSSPRNKEISSGKTASG